MAGAAQKIAIVSVYDKTGLLDLAKGLVAQNVRILASGGTSRMIRESGFPVEYVYCSARDSFIEEEEASHSPSGS